MTLGNQRVLVVDDEAPLRMLVEQILKRMGLRVLTAVDGEEAVACFRAHADEITFVILDLTMPKMDGYTFMAHLQEEEATRDIPVMVLTGREGMKDTFQMFTNVVDFVPKPFDIKELRARIQAVLDKGKPR